jgi:hypothetical protein
VERHLKARKTQWYNPFAFLVEDEFFLGELHVGNMTEASFAGLEKLSVLELERSVERVVKCERQNVAAMIAHLAEMARREAHLELGYKNLFEYCVRHLRLSEGSVWCRRKRAAPAAKPCPDEARPPGKSRYIPSSERERLMEKASYQCEYRGARCTARAGLEIDHIDP